MGLLENAKPTRVFYYFEQICGIPHGSGNTKQISDFLVDFAKEHSLEFYQDQWNNVIIYKDASPGYEDHETIIMQGHMDMVSEKDSDCDIDLEKEGLRLALDGDYLYAKGTTLGADDGIAVAYALAILEDDSLAHPPLEVVVTTDEEIGMVGAEGFDASKLHGKIFLNVDSETEGVFTAGCAGGSRPDIFVPLHRAPLGKKCCKVTLGGLTGGHSGHEIHRGGLNANITLGKFINGLGDINIVDIRGGDKDNAIPRESVCILSCDGDIRAAADKFVKDNYNPYDPDFYIDIEDAGVFDTSFDAESSKKVAKLLSSVINGVQSMSDEFEGLVHTSLNLGILLINDKDELALSFAARSNVDDDLPEMYDKLEQSAKQFGGRCIIDKEYPAWPYLKDSRLRKIMVDIFEEMYGYKPSAIPQHIGVECSVFSQKIPGFDAVSFGPTMLDIHTTRERLDMPSAARTYDYICRVLAAL